MHFFECDLCSVVDLVLYELEVGFICHWECISADFGSGVVI